jgi:streptogramin lyase
MNKKRLFFLFVALLSLLAVASPAIASLLAQETDLNPSGTAFELNLDSQGMLWVTDSASGEIWGLDPASGATTVYPVGGGPSDARSNGAGLVWWADFTSNQLGRLSTAENQVDIWEIPDSSSLYSTALAGDGAVWFTDFLDSNLYKLDPEQNQLCVYSLPDFGLGSYMAMSGQELWLGDYNNGRILKLDTTNDAFTWWQLPGNSYPQGIAVDGEGRVWWADSQLDIVGRLDPVGLTYDAFDPPTTQSPQMLALQGSRVWVGLINAGGIGLLNPAAASEQTYPVTTASQLASPNCSELLATIHDTLTPTSSTASWSDQAYLAATDQAGWTIFALPTGAAPWGIVNAGQIFAVDQGRQKLVRLPYPVVVKACKLLDEDGDLATTADQAPKADFPVYLRLDSVRQEPAKLTGADGCAAWGGLQPGPVYGVEEDSGNWKPLTPTSHDFGPSAAGQSFQYTFINQQKVSIYLPLVRH